MKFHSPVVMQQTYDSQKVKTSRGLRDCRPDILPTPRTSKRGIALIVTLIMLSVITFMTVTFLVLSQRERGSVSTSTDQLMAKQAAESALERAKIELLAPMLAAQNDQLYDMIVSTNYINRDGFFTGNGYFTNVNYTYSNGVALNQGDLLQNIANLYYSPRPPVFMKTNSGNGLDFRYYLDLNRNGRFDDSGLIRETNSLGTFTGLGFHTGDPQWIGVLARPDYPHSGTNQFVSRYAYLVVPAGKTLDVNYIHNQAKCNAVGSEGFLRNQGVGSYEINLGAFFTDLNTNIWNPVGNIYIYRTNLTQFSTGTGFEDARAILQCRYSLNGRSANGNWNNLNTSLLLGDLPSVDEYANGFAGSGSLMTGPFWRNDFNDTGIGYSGADNPSHIFTTQDFFDPNKISAAFSNRLALRTIGAQSVNRQKSTYDDYTYYRMLGQLGTDSEPDRRMNLNFVNVDGRGNVVPGMETNMIQWTPILFFTNAAERMIQAQFPGSSVTNILVFTNNTIVYSPVVNRLLQLAANIYEATGTNVYYPSIYRPYFTSQGSGATRAIYITGFEQVDARDQSYLTVPKDIKDIPSNAVNYKDNVYGIPWIIGARKGFPNLNKITASTRFRITRRVTVHRPSTTGFSAASLVYRQEQSLNVSAEIGVEAWNSYHTNFQSPVEVLVTGDIRYALTNDLGVPIVNGAPAARTFNLLGTALTNNWPGYGPMNVAPNTLPRADSFIIPLRTNFTIVPPSAYDRATRTFHPTNSTYWEAVTPDSLRWGLSVSNRLRIILRDSVTKQVFDYVQLDGPVFQRDLSQELQEEIIGTRNALRGLWNTNRATRGASVINSGINNQIEISLGNIASSDGEWRKYGLGNVLGSKDADVATFKAFMMGQAQTQPVPAANPPGLDMQVPFTPSRDIATNITWQANDPLVHYTESDLAYLAGTMKNDITPPGLVTNLLDNLGTLNDRYKPWGGRPGKVDISNPSPNAYNLAIKDPMVSKSDDWDFPTNKLPNIGWLGRVHRGTPWQTVYMKSPDVTDPVQYNTGLAAWRDWTGNPNDIIATNNAPVRDRLIFDLFTTAPNENAGRGRLSINQTNLAAWSAVLSGVIVETNANTGEWTLIEPAAVSSNGIPNLVRIMEGINATRVSVVPPNRPVFPNQLFASLGDILATPQLTVSSPYLMTPVDLNQFTTAEEAGVTDDVMERIPQQTMSLLELSHSPRFVIYTYGQALRPLQRHMGSGAYFQMVTNYQIAAEQAIRAVVRVDGSLKPGATNYPPRVVVEQFNILPPD